MKYMKGSIAKHDNNRDQVAFLLDDISELKLTKLDFSPCFWTKC